MAPVLPPHRLRFVDEAKTRLAIDWRDNHASEYPLPYLRGWCPCATCQGHAAASKFVPGGDSRVSAIRAVGNYAVTFEWGDGHATGIYSWDRLRELCPCAACGGPAAGTPADVVSTAR